MKRILALLLTCALELSMLSGCSGTISRPAPPNCDGFPAAPPSQPWSNAEKLSVNPKGSNGVNEALATFGLELLQKTREMDKKSTLVSPLSVTLALSMAANGANGDTLEIGRAHV